MRILRNDFGVLAVAIDPTRDKPRVFSGTVPDAAVVCSANYSWLGQPIGILRNGPRNIRPTIPLVGAAAQRPCIEFVGGHPYICTPDLVIGDTVAQAGPTLVSSGEVCIRTDIEGFRADAVRKADHVAIGISGDHSDTIVIVHARSMAMPELAKLMHSLGCWDAMKCDGGSQATLRVPLRGLVWQRGHSHSTMAAGLAFGVA